MCIGWPWEAARVGLTFGQLANVQTVGIGLYLALAVVQAVSATGVAGLSRRVATLKNAVTNGQMGRVEIGNAKRLSYDVSGLEIGFHDLNRRLLRFVFVLFAISLSYFGYCTVWQNVDALKDGMWFADLVRGKASDGFRMLMDRGMVDHTFEAVALRHQGMFEDEVVSAAADRLRAADTGSQ